MNNKTSIRKVNFFFAFSQIIAIFTFVITMLLKIEYGGIIGLSGLMLFLVLFFSNWFGGFYYVEVEVENNSILKIKHYKLVPFRKKFKMFQIPFKRLHKVEVKKYLFGIFTFMYVYENSKKGIARYPGVGFSAFPKSELKKVMALLNKLIQIK